MSEAGEIFDECRKRGIRICRIAGRVAMYPLSAVTQELLDRVAYNRPELLRLLRETDEAAAYGFPKVTLPYRPYQPPRCAEVCRPLRRRKE